MTKITVLESNNIDLYPPVQNLVRCLMDLGYKVDLISSNTSKCADDILKNPNCKVFEIPTLYTNNTIKKWKNRIILPYITKNLVKKSMDDSDILWTTSMHSIRSLGREALKYKNVLQLMELAQYGYSFHSIIKFPIDELARKSWKTVVPEVNRAYIQKTWWKLRHTPYVLPNKPYSIDPGQPTNEVKEAISLLNSEKKKIVLYLGGIFPDRNLRGFAEAIKDDSDYVMYIVGHATSDQGRRTLDDLIKNYGVKYLGSFKPPHHLALVKYAYIGLLPYKPMYGGQASELNAQYCAPNKIFEYAGYGVPMVGSDVIGLRYPFEKWDIGCCCDEDSVDSIKKVLYYVSDNHDVMRNNCFRFFESVDLKKIIKEIVEE